MLAQEVSEKSSIFEDLLECAGYPLTIDVETTGLHFWEHSLIGLGFHCPRREKQGYIPTLDEYSARAVLEAVKMLSEDPKTILIGHNIGFEALFLDLNLRKVKCKFYDTSVMAHLDDSRQRKALENVAERYLGIKEAKRVYRDAGRQQPIHKWPTELTARYCINDCVVEYDLFKVLWGKLKEQNLLNLLYKDMKYVALLTEVTRRGMQLDQEFLDRARIIIEHNVVLMESELKGKFKELGADLSESFNWRSTKQLSEALYEGIGIGRPVNPYLNEEGVDVSKGKSPLFNTYNGTMTSRFLLMEKAKHPLGPLVLDLRESDKLARNYCKSWKELVDVASVIHGGFNPTGTRTGRLSSREPNLQNLPGEVRVRETQSVYSGGAIRSDEYNLRQAFRARAGHAFLSVDHKQQEMRMFALLSKDEKMIEAVRNRLDIHSYVAMLVWGVADKVHREWSKTIGFGLLYGMTTGTLFHRLNMTQEEANHVTNTYFTQFPRVMPYMAEVIQEVKRNNYLRYWSGRIWREEDPRFFYRGVNALVQGGGADLLSIGALRAQEWLDANDAGHIVSFIHDELLMEVKDEALAAACAEIPKIMEVEDIFDAPFLTDWKIGPNYGMLKEAV